MTAALELKSVVKKYRKRRALDELSLSVPRGSVFGLVGSNGAGKTTALCSIMGLLKIKSGSINLLGQGAFNPNIHAGKVSVLPQDAQLPEHATLEQVMNYYARLQSIPRDEVAGEVDNVLRQVNLFDRKKDKIRALSHGMRRRATIAQAFLGDPELVLLDEPLNGLDPVEVANIRTQILKRKGGKTTVISSHILKEVEAVCDYVAFIENGKLVKQDKLQDITRTQNVMTYIIENENPDIAALSKELTAVSISYHAETRALSAEYDAAQMNQADLNNLVLPVLLSHEIGIIAMKPGRDLEREYLDMKKPG